MHHYDLQTLAKCSVVTFFFPMEVSDLQLCDTAVDQKSQINLLI